MLAGGMLSGNVSITETNGSVIPADEYYVYIIGSPFIVLTDESGDYHMENIPEGSYSIDAYKAVYRQVDNSPKSIIEITGDSLSIHNLNLIISP